MKLRKQTCATLSLMFSLDIRFLEASTDNEKRVLPLLRTGRSWESLFFWWRRPSQTYRVNMIGVVFDDDPVTGFHTIAPVYDVTIDRIKTAYPWLNGTLHYYTVYNGSTERQIHEQSSYQTILDTFLLLSALTDNGDISAIFSPGIIIFFWQTKSCLACIYINYASETKIKQSMQTILFN